MRSLGAAVAAIVTVGQVGACVDTPAPTRDEAFGQAVDAATVCGGPDTVKGIDVSVYQGTIDWTKVKTTAGVDFAFIRVSDGLHSADSKFASNWANAKAAGVLRGAYQFFEPAQDPIAQADMLIQAMGTLGPDDLSPVIDVEATGGKSPAQVAAAVDQWIVHVKAATGRQPIVYTGFYFWRDSVGGADETASPLWHAQYTSAACPNIAAPWTTWAIWQYSSTGSVAGISGNVDMDRFNGTRDQLLAQLAAPTPPKPCEALPAEGGIIDDGDACFATGGPSQYVRAVATAGEGGDLEWTHATADATESNFATWTVKVTTAGRYHVEAYTAAAFAQSKQATYAVTSAGGAQTDDVVLDQRAADGWQALGDFDFAVGDGQRIHLGDNTGEPIADNVQLVFDAVRLTRLPDGTSDPNATDPMKVGTGGGCAVGGGDGGLALALGIALASRRRRRR